MALRAEARLTSAVERVKGGFQSSQPQAGAKMGGWMEGMDTGYPPKNGWFSLEKVGVPLF